VSVSIASNDFESIRTFTLRDGMSLGVAALAGGIAGRPSGRMEADRA
jgi:hypothetical protein